MELVAKAETSEDRLSEKLSSLKRESEGLLQNTIQISDIKLLVEDMIAKSAEQGSRLDAATSSAVKMAASCKEKLVHFEIQIRRQNWLTPTPQRAPDVPRHESASTGLRWGRHRPPSERSSSRSTSRS